MPSMLLIKAVCFPTPMSDGWGASMYVSLGGVDLVAP